MNLLRILISGCVVYYVYLELHCSTGTKTPLLKKYRPLPDKLMKSILEQE